MKIYNKFIYIFMINIIFLQSNCKCARNNNTEFTDSMNRIEDSADVLDKKGVSTIQKIANFFTGAKNVLSKTEKEVNNEENSLNECTSQLKVINNKFNTIYNYTNNDLNKILKEVNDYDKVNKEMDNLILSNNYSNSDLLNKINELRNISYFIHQHIGQLQTTLNNMVNEDDVNRYLSYQQKFGNINKNNNSGNIYNTNYKTDYYNEEYNPNNYRSTQYSPNNRRSNNQSNISNYNNTQYTSSNNRRNNSSNLSNYSNTHYASNNRKQNNNQHKNMRKGDGIWQKLGFN